LSADPSMTFPQAGGREKQMRYCGTAKTNSSRRPRPGPPRGSIFGWWRSLAPSSAGISRCRLCGNPALSNPEINPCRRVGGLRRVSFGTVFAPARDARLDRAQAENLAVSREPRPRGVAPCGNQDANLSGAQRPWLDFDGAKIRRNGYRDCQLRERLLTPGQSL
jgi:hypothetical protein